MLKKLPPFDKVHNTSTIQPII